MNKYTIIIKILANKLKILKFANQIRRRGRVARLGSAKAPTAVRIRSMPQ